MKEKYKKVQAIILMYLFIILVKWNQFCVRKKNLFKNY